MMIRKCIYLYCSFVFKVCKHRANKRPPSRRIKKNNLQRVQRRGILNRRRRRVKGLIHLKRRNRRSKRLAPQRKGQLLARPIIIPTLMSLKKKPRLLRLKRRSIRVEKKTRQNEEGPHSIAMKRWGATLLQESRRSTSKLCSRQAICSWDSFNGICLSSVPKL